MSRISAPKSLAERLQWMAANLPGFHEELNAIRAVELRAKVIQRVSEFHQFPRSLTSDLMSVSGCPEVHATAGLAAASYLNELGGLLASW